MGSFLHFPSRLFKAYQLQYLTGKLGFEQFSLQNFPLVGWVAKQSLVGVYVGGGDSQSSRHSQSLPFFVPL